MKDPEKGTSALGRKLAGDPPNFILFYSHYIFLLYVNRLICSDPGVEQTLLEENDDDCIGQNSSHCKWMKPTQNILRGEINSVVRRKYHFRHG